MQGFAGPEPLEVASPAAWGQGTGMDKRPHRCQVITLMWIKKKTYSFIACIGASLLHAGFLQLQ